MGGRAVASLLTSIWPDIEDHMTSGAMVTVTEHSVRIRTLPLSPELD
jgi:hypothetical protein